MRLRIHNTVVEIVAETTRLTALSEKLVNPSFLCDTEPNLRLEIAPVSLRPQPPAGSPIFVDTKHALPDGIGRLAVYPGTAPGRVLLHFAEGGLADVPLHDPADPYRVRARVHEQLLTYGRLEDLIWTALAPLLRRRGSYLVHAFGARRDGQAVLLVGPSGSGKTTTGLLLLERGWELLGNDMVLLYREDGRVWAAPMPGHLTVSERTVELLPSLAPLVSGVSPALGGKRWVATHDVYQGPRPEPAPPADLFFPTVGHGAESTCTPESGAVGLARLIEESVDRWDEKLLDRHLALLQTLAAQARSWRLTLAPDVARVPELIAGCADN